MTLRQVMSPTLKRNGDDFPRLNGSNFAVWNARVRAALDGQGLLDFIDQEDYDSDSDSSYAESDDNVDPPKSKASHPPSPTSSEAILSDTGTLPLKSDHDDGDTPTDAAAPKGDSSSSEVASDSSSNSSEAKATDSKPSRSPTSTSKPLPSPPAIKSFAETKREKERRRALLRAQAKKARAKQRATKKRATRKPSSHERRRVERKTRSFFISTIDDAHVHLVEGSTSAYSIYQKLRNRYEGSTAHGDRTTSTST